MCAREEAGRQKCQEQGESRAAIRVVLTPFGAQPMIRLPSRPRWPLHFLGEPHVALDMARRSRLRSPPIRWL